MPSPTPIFFMRLANLVGEGSMWGSDEVSSAMSSMSKNRAPGMWASRNSALALRLVVGKCIEPSRMTRSGASRCEASQSVSTSHLSAAVAMPFLLLVGVLSSLGARAIPTPALADRRSPLGKGDANATVQFTLLFNLADNDPPDFSGRTDMRATAWLQIDRAILADSHEPHLTTAHWRFDRHRAY